MATISHRGTEDKCFQDSAKSSWRTRAASHKKNLLDLLRQRGPAGVTSLELYSDRQRFGVSPRNRIADLRTENFVIETRNVDRYQVRYVLLSDGGEQPARAPRDWYSKTTGKPRAAVVANDSTTDDLPLFAGVER